MQNKNNMYIELVGFIVLFTCRECREFQHEITYNVLITCRECLEFNRKITSNLCITCRECRELTNPVKIKTQSQNRLK